MDWEPDVNVLYDKIIGQVPEDFRALVKPLLFSTAEKKSLERNSGLVNEADLITALIEITEE